MQQADPAMVPRMKAIVATLFTAAAIADDRRSKRDRACDGASIEMN